MNPTAFEQIPLTHLQPEEIEDVISCLYSQAGDIVDGLFVGTHVPNRSSIEATFDDYIILCGVRSLPFSEFGGIDTVFYSSDDIERSRRLAKEIEHSKRIDPLIIAVDAEGPYILEGAHRFVALHMLGKSHFPAEIVIDTTSLYATLEARKTSKHLF